MSQYLYPLGCNFCLMVKLIPLLLICCILFSVIVYPQDVLSKGKEFRESFDGFVCGIFCIIWFVIGAVTALIIVCLGAKYITTENDAERGEIKSRLMYAVAGLTIIVVAVPAANYLTGGMMAPLNCVCISASTTTTTATTTTTTPALECDSCPHCEQLINNANAGGTVKLTTDIADYSGTCINWVNDDVTFDCQSHLIDGDNIGSDMGIHMVSQSSNTIKDCHISNFKYGIFISQSSDNVISGNIIVFNTHGIYLASSNNNWLEHNNFCDNTQNDIEQVGSGNSGDENSCTNALNWKDNTVTEPLKCTFLCT